MDVEPKLKPVNGVAEEPNIVVGSGFFASSLLGVSVLNVSVLGASTVGRPSFGVSTFGNSIFVGSTFRSSAFGGSTFGSSSLSDSILGISNLGVPSVFGGCALALGGSVFVRGLVVDDILACEPAEVGGREKVKSTALNSSVLIVALGISTGGGGAAVTVCFVGGANEN